MIFDKIYSQCEQKQPIVVSRENGNEHILQNKSASDVYQFLIDGDIVKGIAEERCDYIVEVENANVHAAYVIELKGSDLNKAIDQIRKTIQNYAAKLSGCDILPRIIIHKVLTHDVNGKKYRDFKKQYPGMIVKTRKCIDVV